MTNDKWQITNNKWMLKQWLLKQIRHTSYSQITNDKWKLTTNIKDKWLKTNDKIRMDFIETPTQQELQSSNTSHILISSSISSQARDVGQEARSYCEAQVSDRSALYNLTPVFHSGRFTHASALRFLAPMHIYDEENTWDCRSCESMHCETLTKESEIILLACPTNCKKSLFQ